MELATAHGHPIDWPFRRLGDHLVFLSHGTHSRAELTAYGDVRNVHYGDVHAATSTRLDPNMLTALPRLKARGLDRLRDGDVVLADASEDTVGISKLVELTNVGVTEVVSGQHTIAIRFDPAVAVNGFKGYLQFCPPFAQHLRRLAAGTKVYAINRQHVASIEMPLPPVEEQRSIATALTDVDALLDGLDRLIAKKRDLKQAAMQQLLTGRTRLPGFQAEWKVMLLGEVIDTDPENLGADTRPDFAFNYIALEDVDHGVLQTHSQHLFASAPSRARRKLRSNDVLVSTVRPNLQSHLLFGSNPGYWVCSTGFCVARCREGVTNPAFIFSHLFAGDVSRQIDALLTGSNYPAINSADVRALTISFPDFAEQTAIAAVLSDMDAELAALEARRDKTRLLKQAMMQELLTGRTRLVDTQGATA